MRVDVKDLIRIFCLDDQECCSQSEVGVQSRRVLCGDVLDAASPLSSTDRVIELDSFPRGSFVCPFLLLSLFEPSLWKTELLAS